MTYSHDLSLIHDQGFGDIAVNAAHFVASTIKKQSVQKRLIVDLGCGSGIMAKELVKKGFLVYGIDISKEMISIAKKKVPQARFKVASYLNEEIPNCNAITAIGEVFNYLFDKKVDLKILTKFFQKCYQSLTEDGVLIFDIMEFSENINHNSKGFKAEKDWIVLSENIVDQKKKILQRVITSFVKHGKNYKRTDEIHKVILYDQSQIIKNLKKVGFKVKVQNGYGKLLLRPGCKVYVCSKK